MHRPCPPSTPAPRARWAALAGAAALAVTLSAEPAFAKPPAPYADLSDAEVTRRLAFIESRLRSGTAAAERWWYGWFFGWTVVAAGQAAFAILTTNEGLRIDCAVGAASSGLGVLSIGVVKFPPRYAARVLYETPGETPDDRRRKLARGEQLLKASAEAEASGRSWLSHVLSASTSVGIGLVLWFGYDRQASGIRNALIGTALGEVQIFTQPTAAIRDWDEYKRQWAPAGAAAPRKTDAIQWTFTPHAGGLGVIGQF